MIDFLNSTPCVCPLSPCTLHPETNDKCAACGHDVAFHDTGKGNGVPVGQAYCDDRHDRPCNCTGFRRAVASLEELAARYGSLPLVPPDEALLAQRDRLHAALGRLLRAYPRLASEHTTDEQQRALRVAICALEECK